MDVMQGPLELQVSPPPQIARVMKLNMEAVIRQTLERYPDKVPDEITTLMKEEGLPVSGIWVARIAQLMESRDSGSQMNIPTMPKRNVQASEFHLVPREKP